MKASLKKPFALVLAATLLLSLFGVVLRTILLFTSYDAALGHFEEGALSDLLFPLLFVIAAIFYAAFGFLMRAELDKNEHEGTVAVTFASAFAAITAGVWFFASLPLAFSAGSTMEGVFGVLMLLSSVGLSLHFLLVALGTDSHTLRVFSAVSAILFCVFYILHAYFDTSFVLNSPIKILDQLTLLCFALFFIAECRFFFGTAHNAVYLPIAMLASTLAAADSIPALLYALKSGEPLSGSVMHDFLVFALFLYAGARLFSALFVPQKADIRGAYAEEIDRSSEQSYHPDVETHIVAYDLDQQSFDFDEDMGSEKADADAPIEDNEEEEKKDDEKDYDVAQTTLDFKRHSQDEKDI